jgi:uncharacterized protein (TIGR02145 family)
VDPSTVVSGTMTDPRDGRTYRTVKIGTQTWMAQNLNYADSAAMTNLAGNSWCYRDSVANCAKYGRLYTWTAAMDANPYYKNTNLNDTILCQGVCPKGWHIPNNGEWKILETSVGGSDTAGVKLKSSSGWNDYNGVSGNGTDDYGFSALPAGYRRDSGFLTTRATIYTLARISGVPRRVALIIFTIKPSPRRWPIPLRVCARTSTISVTRSPSVA